MTIDAIERTAAGEFFSAPNGKRFVQVSEQFVKMTPKGPISIKVGQDAEHVEDDLSMRPGVGHRGFIIHVAAYPQAGEPRCTCMPMPNFEAAMDHIQKQFAKIDSMGGN